MTTSEDKGMSEETLISKISTSAGMTVKIEHFQQKKVSMNFKTGNSRTSRVDHYSFVLESASGDRKVTAIPKRLYVALRAFEIDPKF